MDKKYVYIGNTEKCRLAMDNSTTLKNFLFYKAQIEGIRLKREDIARKIYSAGIFAGSIKRRYKKEDTELWQKNRDLINSANKLIFKANKEIEQNEHLYSVVYDAEKGYYWEKINVESDFVKQAKNQNMIIRNDILDKNRRLSYIF